MFENSFTNAFHRIEYAELFSSFYKHFPAFDLSEKTIFVLFQFLLFYPKSNASTFLFTSAEILLRRRGSTSLTSDPSISTEMHAKLAWNR